MFKDAESRKSFFAGKKAGSQDQPKTLGVQSPLPGFKLREPKEEEFKTKTPKFPKITSMMKTPKV